MAGPPETVEEARSGWIDAVEAGDVEAYAARVTERAVWLPPAGEPIEGRTAFREWLAPFFARYDYRFSVEVLEERELGGWCAEVGRFHSVLSEKPDGEPLEHGGSYLLLWRRGEDGRWRIDRYVDGVAGGGKWPAGGRSGNAGASTGGPPERTTSAPNRPPARIETGRLVIRCWIPDDAPLLKRAVDDSLDHLRRWLGWAMQEPSEPERVRARLERFRSRFESGDDFAYGLFTPDESEVVGGAGLHPRGGAGSLEIGYWIRRDRTGRGLATEAAEALARAGLDLPGIGRIRICCDPDNGASAAVPRKLGFRLLERRERDRTTPAGEPRDTLVFELEKEDGD